MAKSDANILIKIYMKQPYLWEALDIVINDPKWERFFKEFYNPYYFYEKVGYKVLAESVGFTVKNIEMFTDKCTISSEEEASNLFASWLPHLHVLPETSHDFFLKDVCREMFDIMQADDLKDFTEYKAASLNV